jgi:putative ABC transport system permease protein
MTSLDTKVLRDARHMLPQLAATALVMACGIGVFVGMRATMRSLDSARESYYAAERFAHAFTHLERAPDAIADRLRTIPDVERIETRIVADVRLDMPRMAEPALGRIISLPDHGAPAVNGVRLRSGRRPAPGRYEEVLASEAFAVAHRLHLGDTIDAVIKGKRQTLVVVGTAISPEYTYALGPASIFPDDRRFGVLWMRREGLAAAYDMTGAFNDVVVRTARNASIRDVLHRLDLALAEYGGVGAIARADQPSAFFVANELEQLATLALVFPLLFLAVASFLVHMVVGRLLATQREQIAALKAFGYRDVEIGFHYAKLLSLLVVMGSLLGVLLGSWLGIHMMRMYSEYFRFPEMPFVLGSVEAIIAIGATSVAAGIGAWGAVRRAVRMPPAEALRPAAPPIYRPALLERLGLDRAVRPATRIVLREIERRPLRSGLTVAGIAMATALTVANAFTFDSVHRLLVVEFGLSRLDDLQLTLFEPRALSTLSDFRHMPGVLLAEPLRTVPVRLRAAHRSRAVTLEGWEADATLRAFVDQRLEPVRMPREGLVLSRKLADILAVEAGDPLEVEILEGKRRAAIVPISRVVETYVGISAHMELTAMSRMLGETSAMNAVALSFDDRYRDAFHAEQRRTPLIAGVSSRASALGSARRLLDEHVGTWMTISLGFSLVMAFGVLYNSVRISIAERTRDIAALRVLGFRRNEIAEVLFGELAVLTAIALPFGLALGRALAWILVHSPGFDTEQFRLPYVIAPRTDAIAVLTVIAAAAASALAGWQKIGKMDMVAILKTRD